jgi:hypothetical protein
MQNPSPKTQTNGTPASAATSPDKTASTPQPRKRSFAARLFDPQLRVGRFMRSLTRTLALIVGFFALGMLATYLLLYKPLADESTGLRSDLAQARQKVDQLQQANTSLTKSNQEMSACVEQGKGRQALLAALAAVNQARADLTANKAADAKKALGDVSTALDQLAPAAGSANTAQIAAFRSRLALALGELDRDPQSAASDLGILSTQLTDLSNHLGAE